MLKIIRLNNEEKIINLRMQKRNGTCDGNVKVCEDKNMGDKTESIL